MLEGLEAVELKLSEVLEENENLRFDPEYFNKTAHAAFLRLKHQRRFGDLVKNGYRVIYENTRAIEREEGIAAGLPFFLQAADIYTPFIKDQNMICVSKEDWLRYPKGRIIHGEVLIEVKGQAEKVAIVPDEFPVNTLVTGTVYKMSTLEELDKYLLASYLTCRYGQALKNRLKTNLLVSFISKADLFNLPVPNFANTFKEAIKKNYLSAENLHKKSRLQYQEAEQTLLTALGLEKWQPAEPLTYEQPAKVALATGRLDAEYFSPRVQGLMQLLQRQNRTIGSVAELRKQNFDPSKHESFEYIEISDMTGNGEVNSSTIPVDEAASRATQHVRKGDVITSTVRPIRRLSALIQPEQDGFVCSSGFAVLQPLEVPTELLLTYLRLPVIAELMDLHTTASMYPAISVPDILSLPFIKPDDNTIEQIVAAVQQSHAARKESRDMLVRAKRAVEIAIEECEEAGLAYLNGGH